MPGMDPDFDVLLRLCTGTKAAVLSEPTGSDAQPIGDIGDEPVDRELQVLSASIARSPAIKRNQEQLLLHARDCKKIRKLEEKAVTREEQIAKKNVLCAIAGFGRPEVASVIGKDAKLSVQQKAALIKDKACKKPHKITGPEK